MKLLFAAPLSGLPSDPTALGAQASRLHFVMKLLLAAPTSGLPFLPTALLAHVSCAVDEPSANAIVRSTYIKCFISPPLTWSQLTPQYSILCGGVAVVISGSRQ